MQQTQEQTSVPRTQDRDQDESKGMIVLNDLVYKLEPDMSVAVNKTHKNHFFQQTQYKNTQPAICIFNSGADYIDTRKSFLHFEVDLTATTTPSVSPGTIATFLSTATEEDNAFTGLSDEYVNTINKSFVIDGLFGENGSILNLIDTVTVTTRSGDELSRIQDLSLLSNMLLPLMYGKDWKKTVGEGMGFGDRLYGRNDQGLKQPQSQRRYTIPLYLLSPVFQYSRLMPAMLMSGLRVQITWHNAAKAFAQVVRRVATDSEQIAMSPLRRQIGMGGDLKPLAYGTSSTNVPTQNGISAFPLITNDPSEQLTADAAVGYTFDLKEDVDLVRLGIPEKWINPSSVPVRSVQIFKLTTSISIAGNTIITTLLGNATFSVEGTPDSTGCYTGEILGGPLRLEASVGNNNVLYRVVARLPEGDGYGYEEEKKGDPVPPINSTLFQTTQPYYFQGLALGSTQGVFANTTKSGFPVAGPNMYFSSASDVSAVGGLRLVGELVSWPDVYNVNAPILHDPATNFWGTGLDDRVIVTDGGIAKPGYQYKAENSGFNVGGGWIKYLRNPEFINEFSVVNPEFSLCSIQLSDMIQRKLNEWSAVNGLEIVYTDYDLTTAPIVASKNGTSVYTEVRKSASRALGAYARIVPTFNDIDVERCIDSNRAHIVTRESELNGAKGWMDYQWQLGSLYFPQQKVTGNSPMQFEPLAYAHTLEAMGACSGRKQVMLGLMSNSEPKHHVPTATTHFTNHNHNSASAPPDTLSLEKTYIYGQPGSFMGGGSVISVSLERSSLFNLSGIPINNSRVLAIRGNFSCDPCKISTLSRMNIYLKYVKLARIFLNNVEVEQ